VEIGKHLWQSLNYPLRVVPCLIELTSKFGSSDSGGEYIESHLEYHPNLDKDVAPRVLVVTDGRLRVIFFVPLVMCWALLYILSRRATSSGQQCRQAALFPPQSPPQ
jgi:hypothetical protein